MHPCLKSNVQETWACAFSLSSVAGAPNLLARFGKSAYLQDGKSDYISLIIGPRGLVCEANL